MVRRIRVRGDATKDTKYIRGIMPGNIGVPLRAGTSIALEGADIKLANTGINQTFTITSDNNAFQIGLSDATLADSALDPGVYSLQGLLSQMEGYSNFVGKRAASNNGRDFQYTLDQGKVVLICDNWTNAAPTLSPAGILSGTVTISAGSIELGVGTDHYQFQGNIPRYQDTVSYVLDTSGGFRFEGYSEGEVKWGVNISGGHYWYLDETNSYVDTTIVAAAGDTVRWNRSGGDVQYTFPGPVVETVTGVLTAADLQTNLLTYDVQATIGALDLKPKFHGITMNLDTNASAPTDEKLWFVFPDDTPNLSLAKYLGFATVGAYQGTGNPATITADTIPGGDLNYPSIIVNIQGFDLQTYDMAAGASSKPNMLAILYGVVEGVFKDLLPNIVPIGLNIRNGQELSTVTIYLTDLASGELLEFTGNPDFSLLLYDKSDGPA